MRAGWLLAILALCALRSGGAPLATELSVAERHALTPVDTIVTPEVLDRVLQAPDLRQRIARLQDIAMSNEDFGIRLRAIRALPHYCSATCTSDGVATGDPAHLAIRRVIQALNPADRSPVAILWARATIEALGATRSGLAQDVAQIGPFLVDPVRDVRATTARALGDLCSEDGRLLLAGRVGSEMVDQVVLAISTALTALRQCGP